MNETRMLGAIQSVLGAGIIVCTLLLPGCMRSPAEQSLNDWVAPAADHVWTPPVAVSPRIPVKAKPVDIPENLLRPDAKWRLTDIIGIALRNNPDTRAAWHAARSAAADWLSQKGNYYPQINADLDLSKTDRSGNTTQPGQSAGNSGGNSAAQSFATFQPAFSLSWLLFDFGGRQAAVDEKRQALLAADFTHNAVIQNAVYQVIQAYFQYANAKAVEKANKTSVNEAAINLAAATQRHHDGLATIADILQAKTALSQARLNLESAAGQVQTIRGALATAMGIPADTPCDIEDLPLSPPVDRINESVSEYIRQAQANRPDLAAQKSLVEKAVAHIRTARSALYPSLVLNDSLNGSVDDQTSRWGNQNTVALMINIPIFEGYSVKYNELKAREDAKNQKAQLDSLEQTIIFQVWSGYFNLKTATQQVKTSGDLLKSAQQSHDVALGRYTAGVGGFLDLLTAQSTLASARAQRVSALANWYISLARLAQETGLLWRQGHDAQGNMLNGFPTATIRDQQP